MRFVIVGAGVSSVTIGGEDKNTLIVIWNQVDAVALTRALIKKIGSATLVRMVPLNDGGFDQEQAGASMIYEGQSNNNYGNYKYGQPISYYNSSVVPQYPPDTYYYHQYQKPGEWWSKLLYHVPHIQIKHHMYAYVNIFLW